MENESSLVVQKGGGKESLHAVDTSVVGSSSPKQNDNLGSQLRGSLNLDLSLAKKSLVLPRPKFSCVEGIYLPSNLKCFAKVININIDDEIRF